MLLLQKPTDFVNRKLLHYLRVFKKNYDHYTNSYKVQF